MMFKRIKNAWNAYNRFMEKQRTVMKISSGEEVYVHLTTSLNMALCLFFLFVGIASQDSRTWNLVAAVMVVYSYFTEKLEK